MGEHRRAARAARLALAAAALACLVAAAWLWSCDAAEERAYDQLAERALAPRRDGAPGVDWDLLRSENPEIVAWLSVGGTEVDYPVTQASEAEPAGFYLAHDAWGRPSRAGNPYLDRRSDADGEHMLVFGHRMGMSRKMFSALADAGSQSGLDALGDASWSTPDSGTEIFSPAFSLRVDESFGAIQEFGWRDAGALRTWLAALEGESVARRAGADSLVAGARRALTLSTCASDWPGERGRILTVFLSAR